MNKHTDTLAPVFSLTSRGYIVFGGASAIFAWLAMYVTLVMLGAHGNSGNMASVGITLVVVWVVTIIVHAFGKVKGWWNS